MSDASDIEYTGPINVHINSLEIGREATFEPTHSCERINGIIEYNMGNGFYLLHTGQVVAKDWLVSYLDEES